MGLFDNRKHPAEPGQEQQRTRVALKTLIDLAGPAASLKKRRTRYQGRQSGSYLSRIKGRGMEFDETRLYQPGDDIRSIDWRVTARTGKAHTKLFREERERPVFISVDYRPAMQFATRGVFKSVQAAKLAALLAWSAQHHGDRVGGQVFSGQDCRELKPRNGKPAVLAFFNCLVQSQNSQENGGMQTLQQVVMRLFQHARPGSLVYLISDFRGLDHGIENQLAKLGRHCDVVLIQVYDPLETRLPASGRYRFTDLHRDVVFDSGDRQRVARYQQRFQGLQQRLQKLAKKMRMTFVQCRTSDDPVQILR